MPVTPGTQEAETGGYFSPAEGGWSATLPQKQDKQDKTKNAS